MDVKISEVSNLLISFAKALYIINLSKFTFLLNFTSSRFVHSYLHVILAIFLRC